MMLSLSTRRYSKGALTRGQIDKAVQSDFQLKDQVLNRSFFIYHRDLVIAKKKKNEVTNTTVTDNVSHEFCHKK